MSLLNRPKEYDHLYDAEGRLQGGLSALEELAQVIAIGSGGEHDQDPMDDDDTDEVEPTHDFPVSNASHDSSSLLDSDEDMSGEDEPGSSDDDAMEEIAMYEEPRSIINKGLSSSSMNSLERPPISVPSPPSAASSPASSDIAAFPQQRQSPWSSDSETPSRPRSSSSRRSLRRANTTDNLSGSPVLGERLKQRFLETNVASTLLVSLILLSSMRHTVDTMQDLFFDFPWNNFLHSVVYDLIHQILTGRIDGGFNRELTIALFRDARLMHRIIEGSKRNDIERFAPTPVISGARANFRLTLVPNLKVFD